MNSLATQTASAEDNGTETGQNATLHEPISADGTPVIGKTYTVPARCGRAVRLTAGETIRIANPHGTQVCDTWIFNAQHLNEFLSFERGGVVEVSVPDLIVILDVDTGHAITTEVLRYGQRVAVLALPCHALLRTPQALAVVGPQAFGLDGVAFRPLARTDLNSR